MYKIILVSIGVVFFVFFLVKLFINICGRVKGFLPQEMIPNTVDRYSPQVRMPYHDGYVAVTPVISHVLQSKIQQYNSPYRALVGAAPDLSHMEKSWAVFIDKEQALELGREFNQHAIYYVKQGMLSLVACNDAIMPEVDMGVFNHRLHLVNELPDISSPK